jgi:hypothetical protein
MKKEKLMKKIIILSLIFAVALTACDALSTTTEAPAPAPAEPTMVPPTAEVIVVTVEVPVEVTAEQPPAPEPTATLPPAPTAAPPTEVPPTEAAAPVVSAPAGGAMMVDSSLWGGYFKDITYSSDSFSLRCQPKEITFTATAIDPYIIDVDLYYRIEDRQGTYITEWKNVGKMKATGNGNFTMTFSGEDIHPDLRKALAWFDFQLVGLNKQSDAVGRTEKIVQLITYTIDCQ